MELSGDPSLRKELSLDLIHLIGKPAYLPLVDRDPGHNKMILVLPRVWVSRLIQIQQVQC
jgi:hypothetical protein